MSEERPKTKDAGFTMRVDETEKAEWVKAAEEDGFAALATWLKKLARDRVKDQKAGK